VTDSGQLALINAEIDGELDAVKRAELARALLSDPQARALRDDLRRLCQTLDALEPVEPPAGLRQSILAALPQQTRKFRGFVFGSGAATAAWRQAAMLAGVLISGALLFELVRSPAPEPTEVVGTIALAPAATLIDTVQLNGPVSGRLSLYRDRAMLALQFEVSASTPVEVQVASEGHVLQIGGLGLGGPGGDNAAGSRPAVPLPGVPMHGQSVDVTFLSGGHPIGGASLRAPRGP